jgi:rhodanese-related sulfurtransferase
LLKEQKSSNVSEEKNMFFNNNYGGRDIRPHELNDMIASGKDFFLLDVRTPQENAGQAIHNSYLIPLQELGHRVHELPRDKEIVVYCQVGNRSAYACAFLARNGYNVKNLEGGILLWNMAVTVSETKV